MMMSSHPRATDVCQVIRNDGDLSDNFDVLPLVPYIQKYVRGANEKGLVNTVRDSLSELGTFRKLAFLVDGGRGVLAKDADAILKTLIDVEMLPFKGCKIAAIFLHDALTDLALGLRIESVLEVFRDQVAIKYGTRAGFATKNLPLLRHRLERRGWTDILAMASFNAKGFFVNPSLGDFEDAVSNPGIDLVAMNTLASGSLAPEEAFRYLGKFPLVESVVVGMSRKRHIDETLSAFKLHVNGACETASDARAI